MVDNDLKYSFESIVRVMGVFKFLIKKEVYKDKGISHTRWKWANFYYRSWRTYRENCVVKLSKNTSILSHRTYFAFSQMRKTSTWIRWWTHKTLDPHNVVGWSQVMEILCLYLSFHMTSDSNRGDSRVFLDRGGGFWKILLLTTGLCAMPYKQENPVLTMRKFLRPTHPNISPPKHQDYNLLDYYMLGSVERETNRFLSHTKNELKARLIPAFTNLNQEIVGKSCRRSQSGTEAVVVKNGDFFE